jgi:hypothetical protein
MRPVAIHNDTSSDPRQAPPKRKRLFRLGVIAAVVVHVCLFAVLVLIPYRLWRSGKSAQRIEATSTTAASPSASGSAPSRDEVSVADTGPTDAEVEKFRADVDRVIEESQQLGDDENLLKLESLAGQLSNVSSERSINELSPQLNNWLGTEQRASRPADEPLDGGFDFQTAQLHEVTREAAPDGTWKYQSVLVDAEGRTMQIEMDAASGESSYRTLQTLKAYPLAEKIYRQVTMPLLDKLIKAGEQAARTAQDLEDQANRNASQDQITSSDPQQDQRSAETATGTTPPKP